MNNVSLIGRLTAKPELKYLPSGSAITKFNIAVSRSLSRKQKEECKESGKPTADFPRIVVWGKLAESCSNYLDKGKLVGITGSVVTASYENKNGDYVYITEFRASSVKFLEYGDTIKGNEIEEVNSEALIEDVPF
ncbi:single-stranded DNA-binding protein [Helicovermis profundi]|uniref:Single-stranded DNA-binding protein n=1 Tax=Helicovermis profundi TaxID=3065157 RepID=A0AAU9E2C8_9FIRM|nr:single-stranded DNA-binding protein [Clostridia bacterium S502]